MHSATSTSSCSRRPTGPAGGSSPSRAARTGSTSVRTSSAARARAPGSCSPISACRSPGAGSSCCGVAQRQARLAWAGRELPVPAADARALARCAGPDRHPPSPRRARVREDRGAARGRGTLGPPAADARVHGRPLVCGVLRGASRGRRPPLPLDADALLGRAGGARGRVRRRLLPPRLGQEGWALAEHPRRLGCRDRRARGGARRPRSPRHPRDVGRADGRRRPGRDRRRQSRSTRRRRSSRPPPTRRGRSSPISPPRRPPRWRRSPTAPTSSGRS